MLARRLYGALGLIVTLLLGGTLLGCSDETLLVLDVRTDLVPGLEMDRIRARVRPVEGEAREVEVDVDRGADYLAGVRVAEWRGLPRGVTGIEVAILDADGQVVLERPVRVNLSTQQVATVLLSRTCREVSCPMDGGDPAAVACRAGRCVAPECTDENPDACGMDECAADADCAELTAACVAPQCSEGACLYVADDALCPAGDRCDPNGGCFTPEAPDAGVVDAGADAGTDAGPPPIAAAWARSLGGAGDDEALDVTVTAVGSICAVGRFRGTVRLGTAMLAAVGDADAFVACWDADGNLEWARGFGSPRIDAAHGVASDGAGGIWVVGRFEGEMRIDGISLPAQGSDAFLAHFERDGAVLGAIRIGGPGYVEANAVTTDGATVWVVGGMEGEVDFGGEAGTLTARGSRDAYVARYEGATLRARSAIAFGGGFDFASDVALDATGSAWVTGTFEGMLGGGAGTAEGEDAFLVQLDPDGVLGRTAAFGGPDNQQGRAVATGPEQLALGGWFMGRASYRPDTTTSQMSVGSGDGFLVQLGPGGTGVRATHTVGSPLGFERVLGVARAELEGLPGFCVTGEFEETTRIRDRQLVSAGAGDAFLACFDDGGGVTLAERLGGPGDDWGTDLAVSTADGAIYVVGRFEGELPIAGGLRSMGGSDAFLLRLRP